MVYVKQTWENLPAETTPLSADRLSHMETQYDEAVAEMSRRVPELDLKNDFGAVGDGIADDSDAVQAWVSSLTPGLWGYAPEGTYRLTRTIFVVSEAPLKISGTRNSVFNVSGNFIGFDISGVDVHVDEIALVGTLDPAIPATDMSQYGVYFRNVDNVQLTNCRFTRFHRAGAWLNGSSTWQIDNNVFDQYGYCAASIYGVGDGGSFSNNRLLGTGIYPAGFDFCYGLAISHNTVDDKPSKLIISGNTVQNQAWEGIDTHGGSEIIFTNNIVTDSEVGIVATPVVGIVDSSPQKIIISDNVIDAGTYPIPRQGISLAGAEAAGTVLKASGVISNNTIRGHGTTPSNPRYSEYIPGSISLTRVDGVVVTGNVIEDTYGAGFRARIADNVVFSNNTINGIRPEAGVTHPRRAIHLHDGAIVRGEGNRVVSASPNIAVLGVGTGSARFLSVSNNYWASDEFVGIDHSATVNPEVTRAGPSFPTGISWYRLQGSTGWPASGLLEVVNLGADRLIQTLHSANPDVAPTMRRRIWNNGTSTWGNWYMFTSA